LKVIWVEISEGDRVQVTAREEGLAFSTVESAPELENNPRHIAI